MSVVDTDASYEELAGEAPEEAPGAPEEAEEAPAKRKPGRPQGSKNKPKNPPQSAEPESVTPPAPVAPVMRKPGRPPGSKNKPKPESVTPAEPTESAAPAEPASPATPKESQPLPVLDVDFDEGPGGGRQPSGRAASAKTRPKPIKPVRLARSQSAGGADYDLLHYVAEAARAYGAQERLKRQDFYDRFLPIL